MFTRQFLNGVKRKALRHGVWLKALDSVERGILSLASRLVDRVESVVLGVELVKIIEKLNDATRSRFAKYLIEYGFRRARVVARQATALGYGAAANWASDLGFIRYVTFVKVNAPLGWKV
jgi:hypothetical protein